SARTIFSIISALASSRERGSPRTIFSIISALASSRDAPRLALPHHASTIDHQRLARDVASFLGGEEHGGVADVIGRLLALHRDDVGDALLEHLTRRHPREGGVGGGDVG